MPRSFLYIVETFPSVTESFVHNEILELSRRGHFVTILAKKRDPAATASTSQQGSQVIYFSWLKALGSAPWLLIAMPRSSLRIFINVIRQRSLCPGVFRRLKNFLMSLGYYRDVRRLPIDHIHAHFSMMPTTQAYLLSQWLALPFSFTIHAHDLYVARAEELAFKVKAAAKVVTCTLHNKTYLESLGFDLDNKLRCVYHGVEVAAWKFRHRNRITRQVRLLFVGRLVEKKGCSCLLEAIKMMVDAGLRVTCGIVGDGPLRSKLQKLSFSLGIQEHVKFHGALGNGSVQNFYSCSDVLILPCLVASDNDRDGLPNVLLEAMASGLPVITTPVSAIPELVADGENGLLVPSGKPVEIYRAVKKLIDDPDLYARLSRNGLSTVTEKFDLHEKVDELEVILNE